MINDNLTDRLFQPQKPFYKIEIGFVHFTFNTVTALAFLRFFGQQVTAVWLPEHDLSITGNFKSLFSPRMCFNLWHEFLLSDYPAGVPRTGGVSCGTVWVNGLQVLAANGSQR
jgi:hypothetical protein